MTDAFTTGTDHALIALAWAAGVLVVLAPLALVAVLVEGPAWRIRWHLNALRNRLRHRIR